MVKRKRVEIIVVFHCKITPLPKVKLIVSIIEHNSVLGHGTRIVMVLNQLIETAA